MGTLKKLNNLYFLCFLQFWLLILTWESELLVNLSQLIAGAKNSTFPGRFEWFNNQSLCRIEITGELSCKNLDLDSGSVLVQGSTVKLFACIPLAFDYEFKKCLFIQFIQFFFSWFFLPDLRMIFLLHSLIRPTFKIMHWTNFGFLPLPLLALLCNHLAKTEEAIFTLWLSTEKKHSKHSKPGTAEKNHVK